MCQYFYPSVEETLRTGRLSTLLSESAPAFSDQLRSSHMYHRCFLLNGKQSSLGHVLSHWVNWVVRGSGLAVQALTFNIDLN